MDHPWLHRYAILLAVCTLFLVVAGAAVTSHEAGLSVPDWPLSYGKILPAMTGGVFYEHGHRMVATTVGILTIGLLVWLYMASTPVWMRKLGWAALAAVVAQGLLGGLTVILLLPPIVSVLHACLAQVFFATTVAFALFTSKGWQAPANLVQDYGWPSMRSLAAFAPAAVLMQIALGASFRHKALGIMPHILGAMLVALVLMILGAFVLHQFSEHKTLKPFAALMMGMTFLQIFLGIAALIARSGADASKEGSMLVTTIAHVAGGGLLLSSTVLLSIQIFRNVRKQLPDSPPQQAVTS